MSLKTFAKNTFVYSIGSIAVRFSTFLLIPLYIHYLSVPDFGLLSVLILTTQILIMIMDFGIMPSIIRFTDEYEKSNSRGELLGSSLLINLLTGVTIVVISVLLISPLLQYLFRLSSGLLYSLLIAASAIFQCLSINLLAHFRAINKAKFFIYVSISLTLLYLFTTIIFVVYFGWGIKGVLLGQVISYGLIWIYLMTVIFRRSLIRVSKNTLKKLLRFGFPLMFARGGDLVLDASILYMLGYFTSLIDVGIFSLATKLASILLVLLITPFQLSYEPYIYSQLDDSELPKRISKILTYMVVVFVFLGLTLLIGLKGFIAIIAPEEYSSAYSLVFFILPVYLFRGISSISQALIHIQKNTYITGWTISISTILCLILGYFGIKFLGIWAAIVISNLYWLSIALVLMIFGQKKYPILLEKEKLLSLAGAYVIINFLFFQFKDFNVIIFFAIATIILFLLGYLLFKFNFFDKQEKQVINVSFNKALNWLGVRTI